ncbi:bifunctional GTP diphosphokinase/guanosine-3',5'-bis pyrophosphate 3'-pyrophosphohydrolase [Candidatus Pantoea carbekii]|uniref:guanosine-3',5'-bis(diphosphate) 3'-diphosphatase n=1 Tax=Candidatus Pantoea carbekii TaxID=1235990 RepID=U3U6T4_9GAMM|nr:bifunctional GTP diphosphokinase/guanosine-3',5'-bis pyrophosphate 3'-pyrophosphohydrolase [Candidatus Pantoea carbekii]AKC32329.1 guanosine-3,5-bis(diphosphate) 3-pyrophosphohydrolase [Candidatus Pantoea carbekii]BAO00047.1 SpoT protein [Candidatus Pantoea carbekii]
MYLFKSLNKLIEIYLPEEQIKRLKQVYLVAREAHAGQIRYSGEPYITHPIAVACILANMKLDHETLMAALLHDVIEDTPATYQDMEKLFGKSVAELIEGVSKLDKLKFRDKKEEQIENFRKMIMATVQDIRVILIKLADRTHNMRTLGALRADKKRRIAMETLDIYSPLAHRLGIFYLKTELEELGFEALYPNRFRIIKEIVKTVRNNRNDMIQKILSEIDHCLKKAGVICRVIERDRHLYSIYRKMSSKEKRFHSIIDIYRFRVIVKDLDACYRVLGQIHSLYKPRPGCVKDYIAIPKANGYQSLHTSMIGPYGVPVEVQIRTEDMDQMAEMGVAAQWTYKETSTTAQVRAQRWLRSLLELQQSSGNAFEFIESVKSDLFPKEIYVFTPKGCIIELPVGATPVDFAYAVHTDIGNTCTAALLDRQSYPLSQALISGQTIEIITEPRARPNPAWLNFVVSSKARSKIRQTLKNLKREDSIKLGRYLLNHTLGDNQKLAKIPAQNIQKELERTKVSNIDDLLAEIGLGNLISIVVAQHLLQSTTPLPNVNTLKRLIIKHTEDSMLITLATCCCPIPNDPIVAHVHPGKGLIIHNESCQNIFGYQNEPGRFLLGEWDKKIHQEFIAEIKVDMFNHQGVLAHLTAAINTAGSNIQSLKTEESNDFIYTAFIRLTAHNHSHLANTIRKIRIIPHVIKVHRNHI